MPAGSTFFQPKTFCFSSNAYLFRLPFGVSITTCRLSFFLLNEDKRDGLSRRLDFALLDKCVGSCYWILRPGQLRSFIADSIVPTKSRTRCLETVA
jgi:hypothetical protein